MLNNVFFYVFATILIVSALRVITAKNPVHSVLFLVLAFVSSSCLWLMLDAEFLALVLILVYVGAVMVLFLFVVMLLDIDVETLRQGFWRNLPLALLLGGIMLVEMVLVLITKPVVIVNSSSKMNNDSAQLFWTLYTEYSFPVELASLILLLGLVVAVALSVKSGNKNTKYQNIAKQHAATPKNRLKIVKMQFETDEIIDANGVKELKEDTQ